MFSCEETWDIYLTFGRVKKHVRTFKVRAVDPDRLCEPAGTLWLRLPRNAMSLCYELEGLADVDRKEDGLDRGFDISFENPEGRVLVSFETQEDTPEGSIAVNFRYCVPHQPWKTHLSEHSLTVVFHLPIGIPENWIERLGFLAMLFRSNGRLVKTSRLPYAAQVILRSLKEYYFLPWGCKIQYGTTTKEGRLRSLLYTPRQLVYEREATEWIRKGQSSLCFEVIPLSLVENLMVGAILGLILVKFVHFLPIWSVIVLLILLLPIFSRGLIWKFLHLFK